MSIAVILMGVAVVILGAIVVYLAAKVNHLEKSIVSIAVILQAKTGYMSDNPVDLVRKAFSHEDPDEA